MDFLNTLTVNTLYLVLLILGLIYAVFLLVSGQIGGGESGADLGHVPHFETGGGHDLHVEGGAAEHGISPISPLTIATFITAFGAIGLVSTNLFSVSDRGSVVWASLGGLVFSFLVYIGFTYLFIKPQGSSEVRVSELTGHKAEVITPIPENGLGEVALIAQGGRVTFSARSSDGKKVDRGASVKVARVTGGVVYVEPLSDQPPKTDA